MAAGQQKKRLNASSAVSCNLQQYSAKKKKNVEPSQTLSDMSSRVSLEWNDNQKRIVAKREQIGITWRDLSPFIDSFSKCNIGLADVVAIPQEIFGLEDMTGVLSYEVWKTHVSESERNFLSKFLPEGADAEELVQGLLSGENLHFGNPFLKWGASLCSGNFHPDAVLSQDLSFKANKKAYYEELQTYHNDIVENLQKWKEVWISCKDPEKDFPQKILRKGFMKEKRTNSSAVSERLKGGTISRKEENLQKMFIRSGDAAKYMSYFKISKKQHGLVKRIKQSGDGIQSNSLNRVLGDIKGFRVQPYEAFEAEEHKKLHEHWLQMTSRDLPLAFAHWTKRKLHRQQWRMSLEQELAEKKKDLVVEDEDEGHPDSLLEERRDNGETYHQVGMDVQNSGDDEESAPHSINSQRLLRVPSLNGHYELNHTNREPEKGNQDNLKPKGASPILHKIFGTMNPSEDSVERGVPTNYAKESVTLSKNNQPLQRIPSLNSHLELDRMDVEREEEAIQVIMRSGAATNLSEVIGHMNATENSVGRGVSISSAKDVWPAAGMLDPYQHPISLSHGYTSAELSLRQPNPIRQHPARLIDLEADTFERNVEETLFQRRPSNDIESALHINRGGSVLGSYTNNDCNDLQPFLKGQGMGQGMPPSYPHEHKQLGIQFLETRNGSLGTGIHHPGHFREQQQQPLEQRQQMSDGEFYMHQAIHKNIYSDSGRYPNPNPSQGLFPQVDMQNWAINPVRLSAPSQSLSNGERLSGKNWFSNERGIRGGWPGVEVSGIAGQCLGSRGDTDESLYSIFSQHNKLQSHSYDPVTATEQYLPMRDFVGRGISGNNNFFPHTGHQLNHLRGHEAASTATATPTPTPNLNSNNNTSWMNSTHQSSSIHDPIQKPFLRSWN
ncbi:Nuclear factor related to kappa-B-binding protein [Macleaya cordata]|uniref:Nuclear factor related to kappa-B-binding protein n=1 Tax=Macleaya cordata TaxID=56857 RepID=A0A200R3R7_MACCD|nr:Nuclear factor related to kappa-B-binding protein [Macleaya cordata]